jgi:hypothetical protein
VAEALDLYYKALKRLEEGTSIVLPAGTKISNDAVSLEAGRKKGSIKKSRPGFSDLIAAIKKAQENQRAPLVKSSKKDHQVEAPQTEEVRKLGTHECRYRTMYEALLAERAAVLLDAFKQREEIKSLRATVAAQAIELTHLGATASALEAELTRLRGGKLQPVSLKAKRNANDEAEG